MTWGHPSWRRPCSGLECPPTSATLQCSSRKPTTARARRTDRPKQTGSFVSLIWSHLVVVEIDSELSVGKQAGAALFVGNRVHAIDQPALRLGLPGGPGFAADPGLSVGG